MSTIYVIQNISTKILRWVMNRHVNNGGPGGVTPLQCLENAIAVEKSLTAIGIY